ncbi:MAG TPA: hypothetical protein VFM43_03010 [Gaiellaceae bacterium]|nr:hypothetical protein [Gaiellaceae bacterium]
MNINLLELLAIWGRINPAIFDVIHPMGPERAFSVISPADAVELNPQPLPPRAELQLAAARVANEIALAAVAAEAAGNDEAAERIVMQAVDDWCGTPSGHRPIPWPGPWPFPSYLEDPTPVPWLVDTVRLVGALTLASVGSRMAEGAAREALGHGAERLMDAALAGVRSEQLQSAFTS